MDFNDLNTIFFVWNSTFIPFNQIWEILNISKSFDIATYNLLKNKLFVEGQIS